MGDTGVMRFPSSIRRQARSERPALAAVRLTIASSPQLEVTDKNIETCEPEGPQVSMRRSFQEWGRLSIQRHGRLLRSATAGY